MRVATRLVDEKEAELVVLVDAEELSALRRSVPVWRPRLVPTQHAVGEGRPRQRRRVSAHADLREMRHEALVARRLERRVHQHQGLAVPRAERPPRPAQQDAELDKAVALQNHVHHVVPEHLLLLVSARARLHRVVEHRRDGAPLRKRRTLVRARADAVWHAGVRVDEARRHLCQKRSAKPRPRAAAPPGVRLQWHPTAKRLGGVCCFEHRQCRAARVLHVLLHPVHWQHRLAGVHKARAALRRRGAFGVAHAAPAQQHVEEVAHCVRRRRLLQKVVHRQAAGRHVENRGPALLVGGRERVGNVPREQRARKLRAEEAIWIERRDAERGLEDARVLVQRVATRRLGFEDIGPVVGARKRGALVRPRPQRNLHRQKRVPVGTQPQRQLLPPHVQCGRLVLAVLEKLVQLVNLVHAGARHYERATVVITKRGAQR